MGWTINAAHGRAWAVLVLLIVLALVPVSVVLRYGAINTIISLAFSMTTICLISRHLASKTE